VKGDNIKLTTVVRKMVTVSCMDMIRALSKGETDPEFLASMARGTMRSKAGELERALYDLV